MRQTCVKAPCPDVNKCVPLADPKTDDCGGCPTGQVCKLQQVQCVKAPCPPIPECVPLSNAGKCDPPCALGEKCILEEVKCKMAPCPPVASCVKAK